MSFAARPRRRCVGAHVTAVTWPCQFGVCEECVFRRSFRQVKKATTYPNIPLGLAHDVPHEAAVGRLRDDEVLWPAGHVLQVEAHAVRLRQRVQVDRVEPEHVVARELPQRRHSQFL